MTPPVAAITSPTAYLVERLATPPHLDVLKAYEAFWEREGKLVSDSVDRAGTPQLRICDRQGARVDEILFPAEYWRTLRHGYETGVVWRAFADKSLVPFYLLSYVTSFYDPGLACPYTVSLATAVPLSKYAAKDVRERFLPAMLRRDATAWQGATWMTEAKGGSDLGLGVETVARPDGALYRLTGDKYFASNAGAELAVVAARPQGAPAGVRGLALFLLPRQRADGSLNYTIRKLKEKIATRSVPTGEVELRDSEAYLLGPAEHGIYLVLEVLNISRVANSVAAVAIAQRALAEVLQFAAGRFLFGKPLREQPLMRRQIEERASLLARAGALAFEAMRLLDEVHQEKPPYSRRYHLFRLVAHLAKYWTAEVAAQTAKWAMEAHGGAGTVTDYPVERWLREAMICAIWEGAPHRQILDGAEVMERKGAHHLLAEHLHARGKDARGVVDMLAELDLWLKESAEKREAAAEPIFTRLAERVATSLVTRPG